MEQDRSVELHVGCRRFSRDSCQTEDCAVESSPGELVGFWPSLTRQDPIGFIRVHDSSDTFYVSLPTFADDV